ncbi:VWA domain-containing protein [uncultured Corynebacterium sp.]|uniref:VWA domain-containing protein n=1 Tax=uncultured Corynebacterium sp. TaxID=159447 RepID=UPI0025DB8D53|nr:VWA domain-containing protein [uncultured Corynebacterium sp.]
MTSTSRRRGMRLAAALGTGALLAGAALVGTPAGFAQAAPPTDNNSILNPAGQRNLDNLGACIAGSGTADILIIMDESASLRKETNGNPATDPDGLRADAAKYLVSQLGRHANDLNATINVKLAGFGTSYESNTSTYGGWVNVKDDPDGLNSQIDGTVERSTQAWTKYGDAATGALSEFSGAPTGPGGASSDCQAVLFFTDGMINAGAGGDDNAQNAADPQGLIDDLCRPGGALAGLRNSGIRFFTVGLLPEKDAAAAGDLLTRVAEGDDCSGVPGNGAFFDAGDDAAGLYAAFANFIPSAGGTNNTNPLDKPERFVLDNSITEIHLSAIPTSALTGDASPYLKSPDGAKLPLTEDGQSSLDGATVTTETVSEVNGTVNVDLELTSTDGWAGEWEFGYDNAAGSDGKYNVRVELLPGLSITVDQLNGEENTGLKSNQDITATLVDKYDKPVTLDGDAQMTASFVPTKGETVPLSAPAVTGTGQPVSFPLSEIRDAASGTLRLDANITTRGVDGGKGTPLDTVTVDFPVTITPENLPTIGTPDSLNIDAEETTVQIPVTGPGRVWVTPTTLTSGDEGVTLPDGVGSVEVSSPYPGQDNALEVPEGSTEYLPVTLKSPDLADGRISAAPVIQLASLDGADSADVTVPLSGNMTSPVNTGVFIGALIGVLLLAILIPLAVLYLMKFYTGRIPSTPGIHAVRVPVKVENGRLIRTDRGGNFQLGFDELMGSGRVVASGRDVNLTGVPVHVKLGVNPLTAPTAVVDAPAPSISDEGQQVGTQARLPLAVHNHWFVLGTPGDPTHGEVVLAVDEYATEGTINDLAAKITTNGPELLERLAATPAETPGQGGKPAKQGGKRRKKKGADPAPFPPTEDSIFGNSVGPFDGQPGGQPTPFGGPTGPAGPSDPGTSGGGWGSNPGNGNGGPSPFGN